MHILLNQDRANYAEGVIVKLAKRTGIKERALYFCARFNRLYPILIRGSKLTSRHYRYLCQVENPQKRQALQAAAEAKDWTSDELEDRVRQLNLGAASDGEDNANGSGANAGPKPKLLPPKHGTPGLFLVVARGGTLALDLGFKLYRPLDADTIRRLKLAAGAIVRVAGDELARDDTATNADLFSYRATNIRVVDGDTLAATIALPPDEIDKKFRLRGINCPEMDTDGGKSARRFVQALIDPAVSVTLTTTKPDKYDRYLADVFIETKSGEIIFLNRALLENGHAERSDGSLPADWPL